VIYIIGIIVFLLAFIAIGYVIKKKYFKEMDRLESWKIELTERPVLDEMTKVKQLNMTGQTEELFERWRSDWDDIVTVKLPDLEELLFDAEEYIDRYRFNKAKEVQHLIADKLQETNKEIDGILSELNELVGSEEKNRVEIEQLKELYREAKKNLLAHHHTFGKAEKKLEANLNDAVSKFQEYEDKTNNGNYLEARETVLYIKSQLENAKIQMEKIPELLLECQSVLPSLLAEVREGYREMGQQEYYLEHIQLENECNDLEEKIKISLELAEAAEIEKAEAEIKEIKENIDTLFDLLEKEVHAKHYVIQNEEVASQLLKKVQNGSRQLQQELIQVQQSYHIPENEFEAQKELEKELSALFKRFDILSSRIQSNETAQTVISQELSEIKDHLVEVSEKQENFFLRLQALRKDEIAAREKIMELSKKIQDAMRQLSKSNIPGLPENFIYLLNDGKESIENVKRQLEEMPLNIASINQYLEIAVLTVEKLVNTTIEMMENVMLAEKVIQYGNRYRRQYPSVAKALTEAENAFRSFDYQRALEQAATSIQSIDPGAIKRIESLVSKEEVFQ
jgi:septation ring formation regulator